MSSADKCAILCTMSEILIVGDCCGRQQVVKTLLVGEGFDARLAADGREGLRKLAERRPDLVLLDVLVPGLSGFRTCEEIRKFDQMLPIIFVAGTPSGSDLVRCLDLGADDYVPRLSDTAELLARIRRALTRAMSYDLRSTVIRLGRIAVDMESFRVTGGGVASKLTKTERDLLMLLAAGGGRYLTREDLLQGLRGCGFDGGIGLVYVHLSNLRKKLGPGACCIRCDRNVGYRLIR